MATACIVDRGKNSQQDTSAPLDDPMRAGIHSLWEQDIFVDYKIKVEDREFNVHKLVMSSMSDFFKAMLTGGMAEGEGDCVVIKGGTISADVMEILIQYVYTNHMDISEDNAADVLGGAVYFQIKSAINICTQFMLSNIDTETWFDVLALFKMFSLTSAIEELRTYIRKNITEIVKTDNTKLSHEDFSFLVLNWQDSEYELFTFILKWVNTNSSGREQHAEEMLCNIRYSLMTPKQLSELSVIKNISCTHDSWKSLVEKAITYQKLPLTQRVLDTSEQSRVRSPPSFVRIGDTRNNAADEGMYHDSFRTKAFLPHKGLKTLPGMQMPGAYDQLVINNFLVVCIDANHLDYEFYIFDPRTLKWEKMAPPNRTMAHTEFVHDDKHLYAIGGLQFPNTILDSILQYDFKTNSWSEFAQLPMPLRFAGACVHSNSLYISGGIPVPGHTLDMEILLQPVNPDHAQKNLYRLDLSSREWETKALLLDAEYAHEMHVIKLPDEDILCVVNSEYHMQVYSIKGDYWGMLGFCFNKPLMDFPGQTHIRRWVLGNSVYSEHYENSSAEVVGYQKVTIVDKEHGTVEDVKYHGGLTVERVIRTVLAIPPHTSDPEFMNH